MSTVGIAKELSDSPSGNLTLGKESSSSFTRKFLVTVDSKNDGPLVASYAIGVPNDNSTYDFGNEWHSGARLTSKSASRRGVSECYCYWDVECSYETVDEEEDEDPDDPTQDKVKLSFDWETTTELALGEMISQRDPVDGFRSSAGELFKTQPVREVDNIIINIEKNYNIAFDVGGLANNFNNTINDDTWGGFASHTLRLRVRATREFREVGEDKTQVPFLKVQYSIKHRAQTFDVKLLDHGSYYEVPGGGIRMFKSQTNDNYLGLLDGAGRPGGPQFLEAAQVYQESDFSTLDLPTSFLQAL